MVSKQWSPSNSGANHGSISPFCCCCSRCDFFIDAPEDFGSSFPTLFSSLPFFIPIQRRKGHRWESLSLSEEKLGPGWRTDARGFSMAEQGDLKLWTERSKRSGEGGRRRERSFLFIGQDYDRCNPSPRENSKCPANGALDRIRFLSRKLRLGSWNC